MPEAPRRIRGVFFSHRERRVLKALLLKAPDFAA